MKKKTVPTHPKTVQKEQQYSEDQNHMYVVGPGLLPLNVARHSLAARVMLRKFRIRHQPTHAIHTRYTRARAVYCGFCHCQCDRASPALALAAVRDASTRQCPPCRCSTHVLPLHLVSCSHRNSQVGLCMKHKSQKSRELVECQRRKLSTPCLPNASPSFYF